MTRNKTLIDRIVQYRKPGSQPVPAIHQVRRKAIKVIEISTDTLISLGVRWSFFRRPCKTTEAPFVITASLTVFVQMKHAMTHSAGPRNLVKRKNESSNIHIIIVRTKYTETPIIKATRTADSTKKVLIKQEL